MFNLFIRIGFADGFSLIVELHTYDYNNDFEPYIKVHGDIVHLDMDITS